MKAVFGDTYFYLALVNDDDAAHSRTVELSNEITSHIITTTWILTEVGDALSDPEFRPTFLLLLDTLRNDSMTITVPPTRSLFDQGVSLFQERLDKGWSVTDCVSFVVMKSMQVSDALTADHHFEQAGFRALFLHE